MGVIIGIAGIVIGVSVAIFFYRKSRHYKQFAYAVVTRNLIQDFTTKFAKLEILFGEKPIKTISVSKVAIWNEGNETIHGSDIANADPLRISITDSAELLDYSLLFVRSPASEFRIEVGNNEVRIGFDFLDTLQGGLVQLVHTGDSGKNLAIRGSIKGSAPLALRTFVEPIRRDFTPIITFAVILAVTLTTFVSGALQGNLSSTSFGFSSVFAILLAIVSYDLIKARMRRKIPKEFGILLGSV